MITHASRIDLRKYIEVTLYMLSADVEVTTTDTGSEARPSIERSIKKDRNLTSPVTDERVRGDKTARLEKVFS